MKILITGSEGMLGDDIAKVLKPEYEIIPLTLEKADITDNRSLNFFLANYPAPEFIIHAAAFTNVDGAEIAPEEAFKVNELGTQNLVKIAGQFQIPLLYISTDYVFDGKKTSPYLEEDAPGPLNQYGLSKLKGEEAVKALKKYFIVRTAWLYGKNGPNFVKTMLELAQKNKELAVVNDQKGSPTYTKDLARAIGQLIKINDFGIYHLTNSGQTTWYHFALKIFELAKINVSVKPVTTAEFPRPAARPANSVLAPGRWQKAGFKILRPWQEALADYLFNDLGAQK